jgi:hypothetical protein
VSDLLASRFSRVHTDGTEKEAQQLPPPKPFLWPSKRPRVHPGTTSLFKDKVAKMVCKLDFFPATPLAPDVYSALGQLVVGSYAQLLSAVIESSKTSNTNAPPTQPSLQPSAVQITTIYCRYWYITPIFGRQVKKQPLLSIHPPAQP